MTDPMDALFRLEEAVKAGAVQLQPCELNPAVGVLLDQPAGRPRFTYAIIIDEAVAAVALLVLVEPVGGVPCFQLGYAVAKTMRGRGLGTDIARVALEELRNGFSRNGARDLCFEAIVGTENLPSQAIARRVLGSSPTAIKDAVSGEEALQFLVKLPCAA